MPVSDIRPSVLLCTLNARFSHASLGLRYLLANLPADLAAQTAIREFTIHDAPVAVVERLVAASPLIVGFGVYIWNRTETLAIVRLLRAVAPAMRIVLGGPEITHAEADDELNRLADVTMLGEADLEIAHVLGALLRGESPPQRISCAKADPACVVLPYHLYTDDDLAHRLIYVEASRGCPYTCEFCLSSLENGVRAFPLDAFLAAMQGLLDRGAKTFKFVDRTFNLSPRTSAAIMEFFLARMRPELFLHFEMVPDRLPVVLRELIAKFPPGVLQFEVGIQSFTPAVGELISRRMDRARTVDNLTWLKRQGGVHVHADLIIGLPGETLATFAESFDALWWLGPGEIQVGILKLLKGTPLVRHREPFAMVFNPAPPYDLLASRELPFATMQRLKRFAKFFEMLANSARFPRALERVIAASGKGPFQALLALSDHLWTALGRDHAIAEGRLYEAVRDYLISTLGQDPGPVDNDLAADFLDARGNPQGLLKGLPDSLRAPVESLRRAARDAKAVSAPA